MFLIRFYLIELFEKNGKQTYSKLLDNFQVL